MPRHCNMSGMPFWRAINATTRLVWKYYEALNEVLLRYRP
jgi:hypothetical protein